MVDISKYCEFNTEVRNNAIFVKPKCNDSLKGLNLVFKLREPPKSIQRKLQSDELIDP